MIRLASLARDAAKIKAAFFLGIRAVQLWGVPNCHKLKYKRSMPKSPESPPFKCPNCEASYKVVRVEAAEANDPEITCRVCGAPLRGREGGFVLKYFLVERPGERKYGARSVVANRHQPPRGGLQVI
jgi:predicted nucleic acid-binding Zn ribbon protein